MLFCNKNIPSFHIELDVVELQRVNFTKFLGVLIDEKFSWLFHIGLVKNKISRAIGSMYRIKIRLIVNLYL